MKFLPSLGAARRIDAACRGDAQERAPHDALTARLHALLPDNEATFVQQFSELTPSTQMRLAREDGARGLLPAALMTDSADAVFAMRPYAKKTWQMGFNPYSDARLARLVERTGQPKLCAAMHAKGAVSETTLIMALRNASVDALIALVTARRVPPALLEQLLPHFSGRLPVDTLRTWHMHQLISLTTYLRMAAPERSVQQAESLLTEVALGEIDAAHTLAYLAPPWAQVLTWLEAGLLTGEHVLAALHALDGASARDLFAHGFIGVNAFVRTGEATDAELTSSVSKGDIDAVTCMNACVVSEAVAGPWWRNESIPEALYVAKRGEHWLRHEPLSDVHIARAKQSRDINATLLALPAPQDPALRHSMRLRLYAEWIMAQSATPAPPLWDRPVEQLSVLLRTAAGLSAGVEQLGRLVNTAATALRDVASFLIWGDAAASEASDVSEDEALQAPTCFACTDVFDAEAPAIALEGCQHPAILHAECLRADFVGRMEQGYPARCPVVECGHPSSIAHGFAMGLDADQLDTLAMSIVHPYRTPFWANCPTEGCISGADVQPKHGLMRDCAMCEKPVVFGDLERSLQQTREVVLEMIKSMGTALAPGQEQTRPCYHCGTATSRIDGCNTMECGRDAHTDIWVRRQGCGQTWDFISGSTSAAGWAANGGQCFVPRSGDMVRAGIFEPLEPGYIHNLGKTLPGGHATLQELAQANARRLGWLPEQ